MSFHTACSSVCSTFYLSLTLSLTFDLYPRFWPDLNFDLDLKFNLDHNFDLALNFNLDLNFDLYLNFSLTSNLTLTWNLALTSNLIFDLDFDYCQLLFVFDPDLWFWPLASNFDVNLKTSDFWPVLAFIMKFDLGLDLDRIIDFKSLWKET